MNDRAAKLAKNTIVYAIGNFGSKLLSFVLIPIYTVCLAPDDFGQIDLYILASSLVIPIFTVQSIDAAYRRMLDAYSTRNFKECISNVLCIYALGWLVFTLGFISLCMMHEIKFALLFYFYIVLSAAFQVAQQITRGLRRNGAYSASGILLTLVQGITNIALIVLFGWGAESLLFAPIVASSCGLALLIKLTKVTDYIHIEAISKKIMLEMLSFSAPLCVHSLCWWCITSLGTYLLAFMTGGTELSGVYAMGNRFSQVLSMINSIFFLAWQESAVEEYKSEDSPSFYGKTYTALLQIETGMIAVFLPVIRLYFWVIGESGYALVMDYVPALLAINLLSASISFFSSIFNVVKKTRTVFYSSIVALAISVSLFFTVIPACGIWGIIIGMTGGYTTLLIWRVRQSSRFIKIVCDYKEIVSSLALLILSLLLYYVTPDYLQLLVLAAAAIAAAVLNRGLVIRLFMILKKGLLGGNNA
ncbi:lipopolysaccharide biosynthesis protein [Collinsella ihumii]|uniref:lipopolysaccharide biosynthesis protein n=1 Tax=Collinsella ihumii TaxID=1720204 RepID=UPI0025AA61E6|nr:oligosaccharide flippase family protein [Collinsella ihumii]MDN0055211.1 oligosaccharide flippase family protein [Collinsella ihumii]